MRLALISAIVVAAGCSRTHTGSRPARTESLLRQMIDSGSLGDLRWPNFSDRQADVRKLYESTAYVPVWSSDGIVTPAARNIVGILEDAAAKGLDPEDYDGSRWPGRLANLRPAAPDLVAFDLSLTISAMRYVSDLHAGKVNSKVYCDGLDVASKQCDLAALLRKVIGGADPRAVFDELEPRFAGYRRVRDALRRYVELARKDDSEQLPATLKPVLPGDSYAGLARLDRLLRLVGDLPEDSEVRSRLYSGALVDGVKRFQKRHGLDPDGRLDSKTLRQLNTPLSHRVRQLQLSLERWRWVPDALPRPPLVVNIPEFQLRALDENYETELEMKVVVGKAYRRQTPVFAQNLTHLIFRPYWNVPLSIQRAELVPEIRKDHSYLANNDLEVVNLQGQVVSQEITPRLLAQLQSGRLLLRQLPGPKNALGFVKFVFPNEHNVYLHGTPAQALFARSRRDFSHGCIRVEKPEELALWVLRDQPDWDLPRIREAENAAEPLQVNLAKPIPVLIVYGTGVVNESGQVCFFEDIYGHDAALEQLLAKGYPYFGE